jgi:hypothetical protein
MISDEIKMLEQQMIPNLSIYSASYNKRVAVQSNDQSIISRNPDSVNNPMTKRIIRNAPLKNLYFFIRAIFGSSRMYWKSVGINLTSWADRRRSKQKMESQIPSDRRAEQGAWSREFGMIINFLALRNIIWSQSRHSAILFDVQTFLPKPDQNWDWFYTLYHI